MTTLTPYQKTISELKNKIREDYTEVDTEAQYDDMLDECYPFDKNSIFSHLKPSKVLKEMSPTDYRCGYADYLNSLSLVEVVSGEYYAEEDVQAAKDEVVYELEQKKEELEEELEGAERELEELTDREPENPEEKEEVCGRIHEIEVTILELNQAIKDTEELVESVENWGG